MTGPLTRRPVLVYDGDCGFCARSARVARRWVDPRGRYEVRPWQELDLAPLGLTRDECVRAAQFVLADGTVRAGHRAIASAATHGDPWWRPLGALILLPGVSWLAARVYAWVARHRHALPGGTATCAADRTGAPSAAGTPDRSGPPARI